MKMIGKKLILNNINHHLFYTVLVILVDQANFFVSIIFGFFAAMLWSPHVNGTGCQASLNEKRHLGEVTGAEVL